MKDSVGITESKIVMLSQGRRIEVEWRTIKRVEAYQVDLVTMDLICISFYVRGAEDPALTVTEEAEGYSQLTEALKVHLPAIDLEWYSKVTLYPLRTNLTTVWPTATAK